MYRQIARLLLLLLLVSIFTPLALALSTPAPHACCMRKPLHAQTTHESQFNAHATCCSHDCCRSLTVRDWADVSASINAHSSNQCAAIKSERPTVRVSYQADSGLVRAPPQFSIA